MPRTQYTKWIALLMMFAMLATSGCSTRRTSLTQIDDDSTIEDPTDDDSEDDPVIPSNPAATAVLKGNATLNTLSVVTGTVVTLTWTSTDATSCSLSRGATVLLSNGPVNGTYPAGALTANANFSLTCLGAGGNGLSAVSVSVAPVNPPGQAPTVVIEILTPAGYQTGAIAIPLGATTNLRWNSTNAQTCTVTQTIPNPAGGAPVVNLISTSLSHAGLPSAPLMVDQVVAIQCVNPSGSASAVLILDIYPPPPTATSFSVNGVEGNAVVAHNSSVVLRWAVNYAAICELRNSASTLLATGVSNAAGFTTALLTATDTFYLRCTGEGGNAEGSRTVTVTPPVVNAPTVSITANGLTGTVTATGSSVQILWSSTNATSCLVMPLAASGISGGATIPITQQTTFTATCTGAGGSNSNSVTVLPMVVVPTFAMNGLVLRLDGGTPVNSCSSTMWTDGSSQANHVSLSNFSSSCSSSSGWNGNGANLNPYYLAFDGSNDYAQAPDDSSLKPTAVTACTWVKFNSMTSTKHCGPSGSGAQVILFKRNSRTTEFEGYELIKQNSSNTILFQVSSSNGVQGGAVGPVVSTGTWYHVCGSFERPTAKIYVNGALVNSGYHDYAMSHSSRALQLGRTGECGGSGNGSWDGYLNGGLGHVSVYDRALSAAEVSDNCKVDGAKYGVSCN